MNPETQKFIPPQEEQEKEFEIDYEPFDPEAELKNLRKGDKEARAERLEKYKEELIKQKEGIAEIQEDLEKQIRENPDLSQEELIKTVLNKAPEYRLSENQLNLFKETLNKYIERHQAVREVRKQYPHDKKLFEACFGRVPTGFVEVIERPANLYFRCHNLADYAWVYRTKFLDTKKEQDITMRDIKSADKTLGFFLTTGCLIPSLNNAITVEKVMPQIEGRPKSDEILQHEEQHSIYKLYKEQYIRNSIERILTEPEIREKIVQELENKKFPKILINYLKARRENFENLAKDEILAFYRSNVPLQKALDKLLQPQGFLDYFYINKGHIYETLQERIGPDIINKNRKIIEKILNQVFVNEYNQKIFDNAYAIKDLEKMGKSRNEIIYLLITEPLSKWEKLVKRTKEVKK